MQDHARVTRRRAMLAQLAASLMALVQRLQAQQDRAAEVCALCVRTEDIAAKARQLAFARGAQQDAGVKALARDLAAFAEEMRMAMEAAQREALEANVVAAALNSHAADIEAVLHQPALAEDPAALRAHLQPLAITLADLPTREAREENQWAGFAGFAARAAQAQAMAEALAQDQLRGRQNALIAIARAVGDLGQDIAATAERYAEAAAAAVRVAAGMARSTISLAEAEWPRSAGGQPVRAQPLGQVIETGHAASQALARQGGVDWLGSG